ncbi:hypothetical protein BJX63DRAFT_433811 [Aspergillus granulosus]|uniref:Uncharacterized protein n=1 Tax=Aspergillus granulosus TaxID=176169 RepID=A0ABR4H6A1_9EURO
MHRNSSKQLIARLRHIYKRVKDKLYSTICYPWHTFTRSTVGGNISITDSDIREGADPAWQVELIRRRGSGRFWPEPPIPRVTTVMAAELDDTGLAELSGTAAAAELAGTPLAELEAPAQAPPRPDLNPRPHKGRRRHTTGRFKKPETSTSGVPRAPGLLAGTNPPPPKQEGRPLRRKPAIFDLHRQACPHTIN